MSVPALAKNFKKNIEKGIREKGIIAEKLFAAGLQVAGRAVGHAHPARGHDRPFLGGDAAPVIGDAQQELSIASGAERDTDLSRSVIGECVL